MSKKVLHNSDLCQTAEIWVYANIAVLHVKYQTVVKCKY
jgi:hypothetical protein